MKKVLLPALPAALGLVALLCSAGCFVPRGNPIDILRGFDATQFQPEEVLGENMGTFTKKHGGIAVKREGMGLATIERGDVMIMLASGPDNKISSMSFIGADPNEVMEALGIEDKTGRTPVGKTADGYLIRMESIAGSLMFTVVEPQN